METFIAGLVILLVLGAAVWYIAKAKAGGKKCIGCPYGEKCHGSCPECTLQQSKNPPKNGSDDYANR